LYTLAEPEGLALTLQIQDLDVFNLDIKQAFNCLLDLVLGSIAANFEHVLVRVGLQTCRLF